MNKAWEQMTIVEKLKQITIDCDDLEHQMKLIGGTAYLAHLAEDSIEKIEDVKADIWAVIKEISNE